MDGKNSFILYCDIGRHLELLSDEDAGLLFKGIVHYADTGEPPQLPPMAAMAFSFIRAQIDRDQEKWNTTREKRRAAGKSGGLKSGKSRQHGIEAKEANATRVKMLKSAYEIGREAGKEAANPDYVSENSDYLAYKENGIRDALLTSSVGAVLDKARNEKREATGNADANLNKVERWNAIPSLDSYDDMVSAYLLNSSDDTAQKLYDKAGAEATAAYLDIYTATAKN